MGYGEVPPLGPVPVWVKEFLRDCFQIDQLQILSISYPKALSKLSFQRTIFFMQSTNLLSKFGSLIRVDRYIHTYNVYLSILNKNFDH